MLVGLTFLQGHHGPGLDPELSGSHWVVVITQGVEGGAFFCIEGEPHPLCCLASNVQKLLEARRTICQEDQVVRVGQDVDFVAMEREARWVGSDSPKKRFHGQVEDDWAEWASLFDASLDGDGESFSGFRSNGCGAITVEVAQEVQEGDWHAQFFEGGDDVLMGDGTKCVCQVEPGHRQLLAVPPDRVDG